MRGVLIGMVDGALSFVAVCSGDAVDPEADVPRRWSHRLQCWFRERP